MLSHVIDDRRAWSRATVSGKEDFCIYLTPGQIGALDNVVSPLLEQKRPVSVIDQDMFINPALKEFVEPLYDELKNGRGILIVRNIPVGRYGIYGAKLALWAISVQLGNPISQNNEGARLTEVRPLRRSDNPSAYGSAGRGALPLHTDHGDILGLFAVRSALDGGEGLYANAFAIHNLFLRERPELLPRLYEGFTFHRLGREAPGEGPITPFKVPVFSYVNSALSIRYSRHRIEDHLNEQGLATVEIVELLDVFDLFIERVKIEVALEPGDLILINNLTHLHGRNGYDNAASDKNERLLLRVWINNDNFRSQVEEINLHGTRSGVPIIAKRDGCTV